MVNTQRLTRPHLICHKLFGLTEQGIHNQGWVLACFENVFFKNVISFFLNS